MGSSTSGVPWSATARMMVAQPTPRSRATAATAWASLPTRRHASARARSVSTARGRIAATRTVQVRTSQAGSPQRQIRLRQHSTTGRPPIGRSRTRTVRRPWSSARIPQPWDHEAVADIHAELIPRTATRCMRVEPGPQAFGHDPPARADLEVVSGHGPAAHADIQQPVAIPDGIDAGRPRRYLLVRPVLEAVEWPGLQLLHGSLLGQDANGLAHASIREQMRHGGTGQDRKVAGPKLHGMQGIKLCQVGFRIALRYSA
jgi:hypothetical protein